MCCTCTIAFLTEKCSAALEMRGTLNVPLNLNKVIKKTKAYLEPDVSLNFSRIK